MSKLPCSRNRFVTAAASRQRLCTEKGQGSKQRAAGQGRKAPQQRRWGGLGWPGAAQAATNRSAHPLQMQAAAGRAQDEHPRKHKRGTFTQQHQRHLRIYCSKIPYARRSQWRARPQRAQPSRAACERIHSLIWSGSARPLKCSRATERHCCASQGQGGCWARAHCSTARWPCSAATLQVPSSQGQGGCWARAHCSTSRWPPLAAPRQVRLSQGSGGYWRAHFSTSRWPP